jgi:hypothetical protein
MDAHALLCALAMLFGNSRHHCRRDTRDRLNGPLGRRCQKAAAPVGYVNQVDAFTQGIHRSKVAPLRIQQRDRLHPFAKAALFAGIGRQGGHIDLLDNLKRLIQQEDLRLCLKSWLKGITITEKKSF